MFGRMSRKDAALWQSANSIADLGQLMARWLEGGIKSWPGYQPGARPDDETRELLPALIHANQATSPPSPSRDATKTTVSGTGSSEPPYKATVTGEPMEIGYSPDYLAEAIRATGTDTVQLNLTSPVNASLAHAPGRRESYQQLVMPVRLTG